MKTILDMLEAIGIGTNLYLCKVAMDVEAKHIAPDEKVVSIAELDERSCRRCLLDQCPLRGVACGHGIC